MNMPSQQKPYRGIIAIMVAGLIAGALGGTARAQSDNAVRVSVGEAVVLGVEATPTKLGTADPAIADILVLSAKEVSIIGKKVGHTTLTIAYENKPTQIYRVEVGTETVAATIRKMVNAPGLSVRVVGENLILDGQVTDEIDAQRANAIAGAFYKDKVVNLVEVQKPRQIKVSLRIAEVSSDAVKKIGLRWISDDGSVRYGFVFGANDNIVGPLIHGLVIPDRGNQNYSIDVLLQFLESKGYARLLSEPTLLTRSGTEASFLVGSEIPIIQTLQNTSTVEFKEVGVRMKVKPVADSQNRINTTIHAEVSQIANQTVRGAGGTELPVILSRKADTTLQLADGQTLVLGGLYENNIDADTLRKFPWLGDIPVLGALFRHKDRSQTQRELVFFMTPEIVKDIAATTGKAIRTPMLKDWDKKANDGVLPVPDKNADWGLHAPGNMGLPEPAPRTTDKKAAGAAKETTTNFTPARPAGQ